MDWHGAYREHMDHARDTLKRARSGGHRTRLASGEVDARRLSDRQLESLALKDAEFTVNMAIILHNAEIDRKARK